MLCLEYVAFLLSSSRFLIFIRISDLSDRAHDKNYRSYSNLFKLASPRQINHHSKCNLRVVENWAKWSMFALLLAYNYQLFTFFCCVREVLSQQNSLLLQLMGNSLLPWEGLLWVLHLILLVLWISVICSMEDLSFFAGGNFRLYQSASHVGWLMISFSAYNFILQSDHDKCYYHYRGP